MTDVQENTPAEQTGPPTKQKKKLTVRPSAVMPMINSRADINHDGKVTQDEIQEYFTHADFNEALVSQYKKLMIIQTVAAILIIIVLATVTGLAIQLSKESHVTDSTFVGKDGNAVQCASREMEVASDGVLTMKNQGNQGIQDETESRTVIRTLKAPSVSHPLNSKVPDK